MLLPSWPADKRAREDTRNQRYAYPTQTQTQEKQTHLTPQNTQTPTQASHVLATVEEKDDRVAEGATRERQDANHLQHHRHVEAVVRRPRRINAGVKVRVDQQGILLPRDKRKAVLILYFGVVFLVDPQQCGYN